MADRSVVFDDTPLSMVIADHRAEDAVIAAILMQPDRVDAVAAVLKPEHFFWDFHRSVYAAMLALQERGIPIDFVSVMGEVDKHGGAEDAYTAGQLSEMAMDTSFWTIQNVLTHAMTVYDKFRLRAMATAAGQVAQAVYAPNANPDGVFHQIDDWFAPAAPLPKRDTSINAALSREMDRYAEFQTAREEGRSIGFYTGFTLDRLLNGMHPGNSITVAGRPGMGKSTFALNMMVRLAERGVSCLFWSLEMSTSELTQKLISMHSSINSVLLRNCDIGEDSVGEYMDAIGHVARLPIHIYSPADDEDLDDKATSSIEHFRTTARLLIQQHGIKVLFVDYLQLLEGNSDNRVQELSKITRSLKRFAIRYGVVIVALSQLNRNVEGRASKVPNLSDLRDSGSIEQDSDVVVFLYADDYYNEESDRQGIVDLIVAKNRHGSTGVVSMHFRRELSKFFDLAIERTYLPDDIYRQDVTVEVVQ